MILGDSSPLYLLIKNLFHRAQSCMHNTTVLLSWA